MAVQKIEQYRMQNGVDILKVFCKPTKNFPKGENYFYAPAETISLVQERSWFLHKDNNRIEVLAPKENTTTLFHQELCKFYHGCYVDCIDHINMVEIDNTGDNLNVVTKQQNQLNHFTRGYLLNRNQSKLAFQPRIQLSSRNIYPFNQVHREDEACIQQYYAEQIVLRDMMGEDYYQFDFLKYRRGELDLLDLERRGIISEEEAIYKHVLGYSENAWYYLRYGLQEYFKENNIPVPQYSLDTNGFMIHPITGQKLCPFN